MKKKVKKIGNSTGITFTQAEMEIYSFKEGDILDLGDIVVEVKK